MSHKPRQWVALTHPDNTKNETILIPGRVSPPSLEAWQDTAGEARRKLLILDNGRKNALDNRRNLLYYFTQVMSLLRGGNIFDRRTMTRHSRVRQQHKPRVEMLQRVKFTHFQFGLNDHRMPPQRQVLIVKRKVNY